MLKPYITCTFTQKDLSNFSLYLKLKAGRYPSLYSYEDIYSSTKYILCTFVAPTLK